MSLAVDFLSGLHRIERYICNTLEEAKASQDASVHADARVFDFIVLGGGSFGAVVATHLFDLDISHRHRILVLEAGSVALPEHIQNLPADLQPPAKGVPGTVWGQPWESDQTFPGLAFCLGGRSVFWGGWSPYFIASELADPSWPASVRQDLMRSDLDVAARQIGTDTVNNFIFGPLQDALQQRLFSGLQASPLTAPVLTGNRGILQEMKDLEAPLAVQSAPVSSGIYPLNKFNGLQLLIRAARVAQAEAQQAAPFDLATADAKKRLMIINNIYVTRLVRDGGRIARIETSQGDIDVPRGGAVVLAMGTIENTRMALNTVPEKKLIGRNLMAHLRSNLTIRLPQSSFHSLNLTAELGISAMFVKGIHTRTNGSRGHFHIQITAVAVNELGMNSRAELFRKIPAIDELEAFNDINEKWVVITLRAFGEMIGDKISSDPQNGITLGQLDGNGVPRAVVRLETDPKDASDPRGEEDNLLWDAMDAACDEIATIFAGNGPIEYMSLPNDSRNAVWQPIPPARDNRRDRLSSTHDESGTLWMGDQPATSVTDDHGRIWEIDNLYVVGPAVLPTIGSPNPMLSGVALSRRTAERLISPINVPKSDAGFEYLFDGTEKTLQRWRRAGPGSFALIDGMLVAQPGLLGDVDGHRAPTGPHSVFFYATEAFDDFALRLQFRLSGPSGNSGRPVDKSGVFVRFHVPHAEGPDLPTNADPRLREEVAANPAWVAAYTGFEIQIDENAGPETSDNHRTGAIYNVNTGPSGLQQYEAPFSLRPDDWHEMEIIVFGHRYKVIIDGRTTTDFINPRTPNTNPPGLLLSQRGLANNESPLSGYIGLQAHTGNIAFRSIQIKRLAGLSGESWYNTNVKADPRLPRESEDKTPEAAVANPLSGDQEPLKPARQLDIRNGELAKEGRPAFFFALEGEGARCDEALWGATFDLVFRYDVPTADALVGVKGERLDPLLRNKKAELGINILPDGLTLADGVAGRVVRFEDGKVVGEPPRFRLRAPEKCAATETEPRGIHIVFTISGARIYSFFLKVRLVDQLATGPRAAQIVDLDPKEVPAIEVEEPRIAELYMNTQGDTWQVWWKIDGILSVPRLTTVISASKLDAAYKADGGILEDLRKIASDVVWKSVNEELELSEAESQEAAHKCMSRAATAGWKLYKSFSQDPVFDEALTLIDKLPDGSRISVTTDGAVFPWELLYPLHYIDGWPAKNYQPDRFWGRRFLIESLLITRSEDERLPPVRQQSGKLHVSMGLNGDIDGEWKDRPLLPVQLQKDYFELSLKDRGGYFDRYDDILKYMLREPQPSSLIYFFCHGAADQLQLDKSKPGFTAYHVEGPNYPGWPIVFVNACEAGNISPLSFLSFRKEFRKRRAAGLIAPSFPIPTLFAAVFAKAFIARYADHQPIGQVLLELRREVLAKHNPLGLWYSLQCPLDVKAPEL
jgi:hypothetical protein